MKVFILLVIFPIFIGLFLIAGYATGTIVLKEGYTLYLPVASACLPIFIGIKNYVELFRRRKS